MGKRQMDDMMKELLVAGLRDYNWGSLSSAQLLMVARIIGSMESVKAASAGTYSVPGLSLANSQSKVS